MNNVIRNSSRLLKHYLNNVYFYRAIHIGFKISTSCGANDETLTHPVPRQLVFGRPRLHL